MKSLKKTLKFLGTTIATILTVYLLLWTYAFYVVSDRRLYCDDFSLATLKVTFGMCDHDSRPYQSYTNYVAQVKAAMKR